ncbi:MAG: hypothetical protein MKZ95_15630 [Pirellulales bacterium]|nr:hypothetical protein [Pirellulales bacterium]
MLQKKSGFGRFFFASFLQRQTIATHFGITSPFFPKERQPLADINFVSGKLLPSRRQQ